MNTFPMNNIDHHAHDSPHAPHTIPDHMAQAPESSSHSDFHRPDHTSFVTVTTGSPHTTPPRYDSSNPNPQLGHGQLDFIPMPNSPPSAPSYSSTEIPDADDDAKYETSMSTPLTMFDPQNSPSTPAHQYPTPTPVPTSPAFHAEKRENFEYVTFVDTAPMDEKVYKKSSGGSSFFQNVRDPRKKTFWAVTIIFLAIFFGTLGATVWKPDNKSPKGASDVTAMPTQEMIGCAQQCVTKQSTCCEDGSDSSTCIQKCNAETMSCLLGCQAK
ncbi:hypothetical protein BGZ93_003081 [Podila epicladia]|nr:hypothetical protein BGZ92_005777 [Podila epicladia]KAG0097267.1 hypothetical protein BGZ93_003081 [Podila epicladia]